MNKYELFKCLKKQVIVLVIFIVLTIFFNIIIYKNYTLNFNNKISSLIYILKEKYDVSDMDLSKILNSDKKVDLSIYGINIEKDVIVLDNNKIFYIFLIITVISIIIFLTIEILIYLKYNKYKDKNIEEISKMMENINNGILNIDIDKMSEDELSILRDNVYKITLKLKEESINSKKDKDSIKKTLEDISHQLKTPLTSISISLDNILNNDMDEVTRRKFLINIKREINNINVLIKSLLELSRFDVNVIEFKKEKVYLKDIIKSSIDNVSLISDLKNIDIISSYDENIVLNCDKTWQSEALTNIIKNAIEHSSSNKIYINALDNNAYTLIEIINKGTIEKKDLKRIFDRFYKTSNSNGVGIGLSLSKAIVEKDNGKIFVESDEFTKFIIKYYK